MKTLRIVTLSGILTGLLAGILFAGGYRHLPPLRGSFSGGSTVVTNTGTPYGIAAVVLSGTSSNFSVSISNKAAVAHNIAGPSLTNLLVYTDGDAPYSVWTDGTVTLTTTSTNAAQYVLYRVEIQ